MTRHAPLARVQAVTTRTSLICASRSEVPVFTQRLGREPLPGVRIMTQQQPQATYPATLVFNSVEGFLEVVQQRSITEIGCATLKRIKPFEGGMLQRHISFLLLTARDHTRNEVLACSVLLKAGDFVDDTHLFTPAEAWQRQQARAEVVQQEVRQRLDAVPAIRVVDAAYHVHPDVCMRFATLELTQAERGAEAR